MPSTPVQLASPLARFWRTVKAQGMREALRRAFRGILLRIGVAPRADVAALHRETRGLHRELAALRNEVAALQHAATYHSHGIAWLGEHHWTTEPALAGTDAAAGAGPLVSVVMPVWNRASLVGDAIASVQRQTYGRFELLVVDDGSTDGTRAAVEPFLADPRVRYLFQEHAGAAAARNRGLAASRGELVAYLDSDDLWYPPFLDRMVAALLAAPDCETAYAAQLFVNPENGWATVLGRGFDRERLRDGNLVAMTTFVHRRGVYERLGGFDESLTRFTDWDLVLRYTAEQPPLEVPVISGCYRFGPWPRVSNQESEHLNRHRVLRKHPRPITRRLRVLYALEYYPHLSETYVMTEIDWMRSMGVEIEAWSEYAPPVPGATTVPVRGGALADAIAAFRPHLVHAHHLYRALRYLPAVAADALPMTVRGHGFEFDPDQLAAVCAAEHVTAVFQFPHLVEPTPATDTAKIRRLPCAFDPELYFPDGEKDPRLVVRTGIASSTKDFETFIALAARFPRHRFVLLPCWSIGEPDHLDRLLALNRSLGSPVDVRPNTPRAAVAELVRAAGIYLHTHALREPYGMPISIAEAMATGAYVIGRRTAAADAYVGDAGATYASPDEAAALLAATERWSADDWRRARLGAIDRAYQHFAAPRVLPPLLAEWQRIAATA